MRMMSLAYRNFKGSFKSYLSLVLSLSFTVLVFLDFQNLVYSDIFRSLGKHNSEYIKILAETVSFVLACFMFFFVWYSTNVFLTRRKKEIGIYVFMGLSNQKIGKLYMIETALTGLTALAAGTAFGIATTQLFQMILLALSDISVDLEFQILLKPIAVTGAVYLVIYFLFVIKGYISITRSSVLNLISASKKNEYIRQNKKILIFKSILGVGILSTGFYLAVKEGGMEVMGNVLKAVVLVTVGVYFLFGGLIPFLFQSLAGQKRFLYKKQRNLWINSIIFRMKKNYRTYAVVCVMSLCSVTALATTFAMKYRYNNIVNFRNTYTFQLLSEEPGLGEKARDLIEKNNTVKAEVEIPMLALSGKVVKAEENYSQYSVLAYSEVKRLAKEMKMEFELPKPEEDEILKASHLTLLSLITERDHLKVEINGKEYRQIAETSLPYMGYLQEQMSFYIVNDRTYESLRSLGEELYTYNYRIGDLKKFQETKKDLDMLASNEAGHYTGRIAIDPESDDIAWIKVMYSLGIFMFLVFITASAGIMFTRLYNDMYEEKERYLTLRKMGYGDNVLRKAMACEMGVLYAVPFIVMSAASYFSVHALEKMMFTNLLPVNLASVGIVFVIFLVCYIVGGVVCYDAGQ